MPHLVLDYTGNITQSIEFEALFSSLHLMLCDFAGAEMGACKSRAIKQDNYYIADGADNLAFVHLEISLLSGRSVTVKEQVGNAALALLKQHFATAGHETKIQATVKITDMPAELYFKSILSS
jgi:5-carboxymethyl-2-hydroxymuconate isomerase